MKVINKAASANGPGRALVVLDAISEVMLAGAVEEVGIVDDRLDAKLELMYDPFEVAEGEATDCPAVGIGTTGTPPEGVPWVSVAPFRTEVKLPGTLPLGTPVTAPVWEGE
ncbi:MAG: hypothetical protein M1836_000531 [Candelina mexicana]|nr:MAG: hypothetical protein M1836_000531 [Candelina mexicana]